MRASRLVTLVAALAVPSSALATPFVINEVVTSPQQDWSENTGGNAQPFDSVPGDGTVSGVDEYIELKNVTGDPQSLVGRVLAMEDTSPTYDCFGETTTPTPGDVTIPGDACANSAFYLVFNSSGALQGTDVSSVPPGGYVVIGNASGDMLNAITIRVLTGASTEEDSVTIANGASSELADETLSRFPDGGDTDVFADDFARLAASPGSSNLTLCTVAAGEVVINEIVTDPAQDWSGSATPFDGTAGATTVGNEDEYVELHNTTGGSIDLTGCVVDFVDGTDSSLILQDIDYAADPYVSVFDDSGSRLGGAAQLTAVPAGGYVIIGDPPGTLNNDAVVTLSGTVTVDSLAGDGQSANALDESVSRFPNGIDTGTDADDARNLAATPGRANLSYCVAGVGELVINEAVTDPQQDWSGGGAPFDATLGSDPADVGDEYIEILNTTSGAINPAGCVVDFDDGASATDMVIQGVTVAAGSGPQTQVFDSAGAHQGDLETVGTIPAGGFLVIGDPPGTMNNSIVLSLSNASVVDTVDFGTDAPDLNASDRNNEAGARLPNGADTDVGADDFRQQPATLGANNELDECTLGIAGCDAQAVCTDIPAGFTCACNAGFEGDGFTCAEIDECTSGANNCSVDAACENTVGSFTCTCNSGFDGDGQNCIDIDECSNGTADCPENSTCSNSAGSFRCTCDDGFEGSLGECVAIGSESSGGGCSTGGQDPGGLALLLLMGLVGLARRRFR